MVSTARRGKTSPKRSPSSGFMLAPGTVVGGAYEVEAEIGRGGMGVVYRARDKWLGRPVALKLVLPGRTNPSDEQLQREARALASLRSAHVVQVYAFGQHGDAYFLAMEFIEGRSLEHILEEWQRRGERLPLHRIVTILTRIAEGLGAVHAAHLVHRDVKPANIVIEEDTGRPVLVDFGLAAPCEDFDAELFGGTPHYMAPEQFGAAGRAGVGPFTDLYALGCVAFEMLTGQPPFPRDNVAALLHAHGFDDPPRVADLQPDFARFDPLLERALAKAPLARYHEAAAFAADLAEAYEQDGPRGTIPPSPVSRHAMKSIGRPLRILVVDDDPAFGKLTAKAAELAVDHAPLSLRVVSSGREAVEWANEEPPDLVLLDLDMPRLDGLETLSLMRALPRGHRARVAVLSGRVGPQERWKFSILGVRDFLPKPVDFHQLVHALGDIVQRTAWLPPEPPRMRD